MDGVGVYNIREYIVGLYDKWTITFYFYNSFRYATNKWQ